MIGCWERDLPLREGVFPVPRQGRPSLEALALLARVNATFQDTQRGVGSPVCILCRGLPANKLRTPTAQPKGAEIVWLSTTTHQHTSSPFSLCTTTVTASCASWCVVTELCQLTPTVFRARRKRRCRRPDITDERSDFFTKP